LDTGDDREELAVVLELIEEHEGDPYGFDDAIRDLFFSDDDNTRAKNVRLGVSQSGYEIVDEDFEFTELGEELFKLRDDPEAMYDRFAKYILQHLHGLKGIEIVEDLEAQGKKTVNDNVKEEFSNQYDFHVNETSNHWSQMRAWLWKADVVNRGSHHYDIKREKIEELIGVDTDDILELDGLTDEQQAFLRALALVNPSEKIKNSVVKNLAEAAYGVDIQQSNISRRILNPLEEEGYIQWEHVSGKPNLISTTDKFDADVLRPILEDIASRTGVSRNILRKSYSELLEEIDEGNNHERGVALETLTVKIGRTLGLEFVGWRVRARETGHSEVDVIFDDIGILYNRVQIQCKNIKGQLETKHVARELGISRMLQTNTILMIARNGVSADARQFASQVMQDENIAISFLTGDTIETLDKDTDKLITTLRGESRRIHGLKRLGRQENVEDDDEKQLVNRENEALEEYEAELEEYTESPDASLTDFKN
jgi:hypothetical protein